MQSLILNLVRNETECNIQIAQYIQTHEIKE